MKRVKYQYRKVIQVYCSKCKGYVDEKKTTFINIEEGMQGEDILTFECPDCRTKQKSRRLG